MKGIYSFQDKDFLRKCHKLIGQKGNVTALRSLYYPAIPIDKGGFLRVILLGSISIQTVPLLIVCFSKCNVE